MIRPTSLLSTAVLVAMLGAAPGCIFVSSDDDSSVTIVNQSDFRIDEVYLTETDNPNWGPNLIAGDPMYPDDQVVLTDINCDVYDALLVDQDNVMCEIDSVDLCLDDATWIIRNSTCDIFAATAAAKGGGDLSSN